jgi:RNA polymerase sigma factor (sigma-70 family)
MSPGISTRLLATQSDERLLALVRQGHERAFEALVHRYRRPLLSYCRRLALPEARAEDVLQQSLLKIWIALRGGAEVRDLKAWLYRVVHNTAVNAVRDAARDRDGLADPELRAGAGQADLERGIDLREALAEVAALPPLQREVIVRTAVGGYSHEQVASDLGITDGAVRGLLYRARATLRTAVTALTPPPLLTWLGGRAEQSGPAPERLGELAAGGGAAAGFGGLLAKSGVAILAVGTLISGAAAVHLHDSAHHRAPVKVAAASTASSASDAGASRGTSPTVPSATPANSESHAQRLGEKPRAKNKSSDTVFTPAAAGRRPAGSGGGSAVVPAASPKSPGASTPSSVTTQSIGSTQSAGSDEGSSGTAEGATGQGNSSGAQSSPAGSAASNGSGAESSPTSGSEGNAQTPAGDESAGGSGATGSDPSGSAPSGSSGTEGSGSQGAGNGSGSSGSEQSGGVVGTVVHEVTTLVEHLLP